MPYKSNKDLPDSVSKHLPLHAQSIYLQAFNHAYIEYKNEETAYKVAWAAVKKKYKKGNDNNWHPKSKNLT